MITGLVGHRVLQLLQRYGNRCAAGDIVQVPAIAVLCQLIRCSLGRIYFSHSLEVRIGCNGHIIARNINTRLNTQRNIRTVQVVIFVGYLDYIPIRCCVKRCCSATVLVLGHINISRCRYRLAILNHLYGNRSAREDRPLPHSVESIDAVLVVDNIVSLSRKFSFGCSRILRPAQELIPIPSKAKVLSRLQFHGFVVGNIHRLGSAYAAVGIINQGGGRSLVAPDRIEGDNVADSISSLDLHLIARVIGITTAVGLRVPVEENCVFNVAAVLDVSIAVFLVGLFVRGGSSTNAIQVILHAEYFIADKVRIDGSIHMDLLIHVEGNKGTIRILRGPAVEGVAFTVINLRQFALVNHTAQRNFQNSGITRSVHGYVNGDLHFRRCPLGVDCDVVSGHLFTVELKLSLARLIQIPTLESIIFRNPSGSLWLCAIVADICFVLNLLTRSTASVDEGQGIVFSSIVELGAVITVMLLCTWPLRNKSKAHQGIAVFL